MMSMAADAAVSAASAPAKAARECFHCGLPLPATAYAVVIDGVTRDTCCRGCQAVAQTIADNGLASYYRHRTVLPQSQPTTGDDMLAKLRLYDLPEIQRGFVRAADATEHEKEASLLLDGITCAACVWLIEQRLARLAGVQEAAVNYATRRARVRWDERRIPLSEILRAVADLGYGAQPYDSARSDDALRRERRAMLWRLFVAGFGMMQVMMYAVPVYIANGDMTADLEQLMRIASLVLTSPVVAWAAAPFYAGAWRELKARRVGMDVPVALGIIAAFAASVLATVRGDGPVYFDSVAMFVFLLLGARYLEMSARAKAAQAQERLARLTPAVAERLNHYPGPAQREEVPVANLRPGDYVAVRPGAAIPADGTVVEGESSVDESLLTGESRAVAKRAGDALTGGAVNLNGPLTMRVERVGQDTVLAGIVRLMDRAQTEKPKIAQLADRAARWFVSALLVLAAVVALAWYAIDPTRALWITIAVLVVTCPCALSLATPAALTAATGMLFRRGVLVTRGHALETLAAATHFVFDKTGTLTEGRMALIDVMPLAGGERQRCLALAAQLESLSEHPIGRAIVAAARAAQDGAAANELRNVPGEGVEGRIDGRRLRIGTPGFVAALHGQALPAELAFVSDELSVVALGDERGWLALFTLGDPLRRHARLLVGELEALGATVCLLSGDRAPQVAHLARELGIERAYGDATPQGKVEFVRALQQQGAVVAMVGDGVNDAPVLAQAQVSIALSGGTRLAQISADMVLMPERLDALLDAVRIARRTLRVIRQNLAWAVVYNAVALPLAVLGHVTPLVAGVGMSLSSLAVVLNALRLLRTPDPEPAADRMPALALQESE
jgi:Cu2+-exporting ATPase